MPLMMRGAAVAAPVGEEANMTYGNVTRGLVAAVAATAMAADGFAQDLPITFAPRCPIPEMRVTPGPHGFCEPEFGVFGLQGLVIVSARSGLDDVATTGSITVGDNARDARHGTGRRK
jgi:hypothetical protein